MSRFQVKRWAVVGVGRLKTRHRASYRQTKKAQSATFQLFRLIDYDPVEKLKRGELGSLVYTFSISFISPYSSG